MWFSVGRFHSNCVTELGSVSNMVLTFELWRIQQLRGHGISLPDTREPWKPGLWQRRPCNMGMECPLEMPEPWDICQRDLDTKHGTIQSLVCICRIAKLVNQSHISMLTTDMGEFWVSTVRFWPRASLWFIHCFHSSLFLIVVYISCHRMVEVCSLLFDFMGVTERRLPWVSEDTLYFKSLLKWWILFQSGLCNEILSQIKKSNLDCNMAKGLWRPVNRIWCSKWGIFMFSDTWVLCSH